MKIETLRGRIVGCSTLEQYNTESGDVNVKCALHIISSEVNNDEATSRKDEYAGHAERAIVCTGDLTNWLGCIGSQVEVKYIHRVFEITRRDGKKWLGNDLYAVNIKNI